MSNKQPLINSDDELSSDDDVIIIDKAKSSEITQNASTSGHRPIAVNGDYQNNEDVPPLLPIDIEPETAAPSSFVSSRCNGVSTVVNESYNNQIYICIYTHTYALTKQITSKGKHWPCGQYQFKCKFRAHFSCSLTYSSSFSWSSARKTSAI